MGSKKKLELRYGVLISGLAIFGIAAIVGIVDNALLISATGTLFGLILDNFAWLFQIVSVASVIVATVICFSKVGAKRLGGEKAKAKYSFGTWFAMSLTGGIATGIVTFGVNYPIVFYGNAGGVLDGFGVEAFSNEAAWFGMGRSFYEWTFFPYAFYAIAGALIAYLYHNRGHKLTVSDSLRPVLGKKLDKPGVVSTVDTLSMIALGFGITSGLAIMLATVAEGFALYGIATDVTFFVIGGAVVTLLFTFSSYVGMDKGLKAIGNLNAWLYYGTIILLLIIGPTLFIFRNSTAGMAYWLQNFWIWGLDPIDIGGEAITKWWTTFNWCMWIAYAPITGIFLAIIARGRTIREFLIVNWIVPSIFSIIWFGVWGSYGLEMQMSGVADLVGIANERGTLAALWTFLQNLPYGIGKVLIPLNILIFILSFVTAADACLTNIGSLCVKDVPVGTEPPAKIKIVWGVVIGTIAIVMAAFGGGASGLDGVRSLATIGGFVVFFIYIVQIISAVKVFFSSKEVEEVYSIVEGDEEAIEEPKASKKDKTITPIPDKV